MAVRADDVDIERDAALVERFQGGDETAFAELYRRYYARLRRACRRRLGDESDADEAAQEALVRAYKALPRFGGSRRFYPWLRVIAENVCVDMRRRPAVADAPSPGGGDPVLDAVVDAADRRQVQRVLAELAPRQQTALSMWAEGWPSNHIAAELGCTAGAADVTVHRARQSFRRRYLNLVDEKSFAGAGGLAAVGRWVQRVRTNVSVRVARNAQMLTPVAERAMVGVVAVAVLGGTAAGGAAASTPPAAQVGSQRAAYTATAPAPAPPSPTNVQSTHITPAATHTTVSVSTPAPAPTTQAAPVRHIGPARVMTYDDGKQAAASSSFKTEIAGNFVSVDPKAASDYVNYVAHTGRTE